jgi:AraC family transcriptional regulator
MEIALARTTLADIVLLKHGPEPPNVEPRTSVCAWRGVHFVEDGCFTLQFGKREWLLEKGHGFVSEPGRVHKYNHPRGLPADTCLSIRFNALLLECMCHELPTVRLDTIDPVLGRRSDLRFLRWRLDRVLHESNELALDEWLVDLISATCLNDHGTMRRHLCDRQLARNAERIEFARQRLVHRFAEQHRLSTLAQTVGMSTFQFARLFRELVGLAPHQFLLRVRFQAALDMLLDGASVTDACFDCGFSNLSLFSRQFKVRFGQSPCSVAGAPTDLATNRLTSRSSAMWVRRALDHILNHERHSTRSV